MTPLVTTLRDLLLQRVTDALEKTESGGIALSALARRAAEIARLRGDVENRLWLELEMSNLGLLSSAADDDLKLRGRLDRELPHVPENERIKLGQNLLRKYTMERRLSAAPKLMNDPNMALETRSIAEIEQLVLHLDRQVSTPEIARELGAKGSVEVSTLLLEMRMVFERIKSSIHTYLSETESSLLAGNTLARVFSELESYVRDRLEAAAPSALPQLDAALARLEGGHEEDYAQAALSCRRLLKTVADALSPARPQPVLGRDGKMHELTDEKYIARLWQYVAECTTQGCEEAALQDGLAELGRRIDRVYDTTNKGLHAAFDPLEANACVTQTVVLLADILDLRTPASPVP